MDAGDVHGGRPSGRKQARIAVRARSSGLRGADGTERRRPSDLRRRALPLRHQQRHQWTIHRAGPTHTIQRPPPSLRLRQHEDTRRRSQRPNPTRTPGELRRYFRDSSWAVHVARGAQERCKAVQDAIELLSHDHGRPPTIQQLALYLELPEADILDALQVAHPYAATSLDVPAQNREEDETTLACILGEHDGYEHVETDTLIENALACLTDREQRLLKLRFVDELTQAQIGKQLGVSQMQVSRLLRGTLAKLREHIGEPSTV
jgi:RNA polymerase sigma factor (sigma-70 family)